MNVQSKETGEARESVRDDGAVSLRYFNQTGWTAIFNGTDTEIGRMVRVEGWDRVTGTALVVDPGNGLRGLLPLGAS
ncbi:hypothetical protein ACIHBQ_07940 [Streptomyces sp. NPDC052492]|uniref:hypothetical protein n=1 Tax=Streptomyces sp. NPDC052492 TaxID=3365691 RepID=UPI0037D0F58F